jgi:ligand-binding sensor domain-containing protein/signal transduction histidine kinase
MPFKKTNILSAAGIAAYNACLYMIFSLSLCFPSISFAQTEQITIDRLSIAHGLSSNGIQDILLDRRGFLWIGTDNGLNRYDGYNIKIYKNDPYESTSLSDNYVADLYEDRSGRLWIGTHVGLNCYNPFSETFIRYRHDPGNENSLSMDNISAIHQDQSGSLWIGMWGMDGRATLNRLILPESESKHRKNASAIPEEIRVIRYDLRQDSEDREGGYEVRFISEDSSGTIWIGTRGRGIKKIFPRTGRIEHLTHDPVNGNTIASDRISGGTVDPTGILWIGIWDVGLDRLDTRTGEITHHSHNPAITGSLPGNNIHPLYTDRTGIIWAGTGTVLSGYDDNMNLMYRFTSSANPNVNYYASDGISAICRDRSDILWLGTGKNGLIQINLRPRKFVHYQHNPADPGSLFSNDIQSLYRDRSGKIWITAFGNGIGRFDPESETFRHFRHDPAEPSSLKHDYVAAFCEDYRGYIWLGTWAGISRFDPASETFTHFKTMHPHAKEYKKFSVKHIFEDRSKRLWFGTYDGGLYELLYQSSDQGGYAGGSRRAGRVSARSVQLTEGFDPVLNKRYRFIHYMHDPDDVNSISSNAVRGIFEDRSGNLWITTANAINLFDRETGIFRNISHEAGLSETYGPYNRRRFFESRNGKLWFFSRSLGLCRLDLSGTGSERFRAVPDTLPEDAFMDHYDFYEFSGSALSGDTTENTIWIASKYGLYKLDPRTETFVKYYNREDGLPDEPAGRIVGDNLGRLWLLSVAGLTFFDENSPAGEKSHHFGIGDGVVNSPYGNHLKGESGDIYWGGGYGLHRFFPGNLKKNLTPAPVVLTGFTIFNKPARLDTAITCIRNIALSYKQNTFTFFFASLDYSSPQNNRYAYRLEGFTNDWIYIANENYVHFTNIPPGEYIFRVKGSNSDGMWNKKVAFVTISISPPFWVTWWFRVLLSLLVLGLLYAAHSYMMSRRLVIERTRNRIARDLHDEIGSSLSSIALASELVQTDAEPGKGLNKYLRHIRQTSRKLIESMDDIVWSINPDYDKMDNLFLRMKDFASELLTQSQTRYTIRFPDREFSRSLPMVFRRNLFLIYKEILHNIVKHANAAHVEIELTKKNDVLVLNVSDDGSGFEAGKVKNGTGLKSMRSRTEELGGELDIIADKEQGTTVKLEVKIP